MIWLSFAFISSCPWCLFVAALLLLLLLISYCRIAVALLVGVACLRVIAVIVFAVAAALVNVFRCYTRWRWHVDINVYRLISITRKRYLKRQLVLTLAEAATTTAAARTLWK